MEIISRLFACVVHVMLITERKSGKKRKILVVAARYNLSLVQFMQTTLFASYLEIGIRIYFRSRSSRTKAELKCNDATFI